MNAFLLQAYCGFYSPIEAKYLPAIATGETNTTRPAVFVGSEIPRGFRPVDILHKSCNGPFETLFAWMSQNVNLNTHDYKLEQTKKPLGANENFKWKSAGNRHCPSHWLVERVARVFFTNGTERVKDKPLVSRFTFNTQREITFIVQSAQWLKNLRSFSFGRKLGLWRIWRRS